MKQLKLLHIEMKIIILYPIKNQFLNNVYVDHKTHLKLEKKIYRFSHEQKNIFH